MALLMSVPFDRPGIPINATGKEMNTRKSLYRPNPKRLGSVLCRTLALSSIALYVGSFFATCVIAYVHSISPEPSVRYYVVEGVTVSQQGPKQKYFGAIVSRGIILAGFGSSNNLPTPLYIVTTRSKDGLRTDLSEHGAEPQSIRIPLLFVAIVFFLPLVATRILRNHG